MNWISKQRLRVAAVYTVSVIVNVAAYVSTASSQDTPMIVQGVKTVSAEEVKILMANGAKLYDLRKKASYVEHHIPGAIHANFDEKSAKAVSYDASFDAFDLGQLPKDKNTALIFHGHGVDGWKGYKSSIVALKAGYKNVYFFRGGYEEWISKKFPIE